MPKFRCMVDAAENLFHSNMFTFMVHTGGSVTPLIFFAAKKYRFSCQPSACSYWSIDQQYAIIVPLLNLVQTIKDLHEQMIPNILKLSWHNSNCVYSSNHIQKLKNPRRPWRILFNFISPTHVQNAAQKLPRQNWERLTLLETWRSDESRGRCWSSVKFICTWWRLEPRCHDQSFGCGSSCR